MPVISRRYSTTSGASLPPSGTYRSSALDRSYCSSTTNSYMAPRTTHTRISSTYDTYRFEEPKKTTTISTYQKYSKGLDSVDTSRYRRSESRSRDTTLGESTALSRNEAVYNRIMATSAADIISKYSPANYVPKCELIRSRSLSDPRNIKEKSQVNCSICQSKITPQFNALNIPCNNTKCISNINKTNNSVRVQGLSCVLSSTNKFNSFDITNSGTKTKPVYRTIPEPNRASGNSMNVSGCKKDNIEKLHKVPSKENCAAPSKVKKALGGKRRFDNLTENKIESCPDIRQWPVNIEHSKNDSANLPQSNHLECKRTSYKTKDITTKFDSTSVNKVSTGVYHDNLAKKNKNNVIKVHNNVESDNNGNKLGNSVAEIRKKFGHEQSKNSSYVVWTNLGKAKKVAVKPSADNTTGNSVNSNFKKNLRSIKNINTESTEKSNLKRSHKKTEEVTNCQELNVDTEGSALQSNLKFTRSIDKTLDNKNHNIECMNVVNTSNSGKNGDELKQNNNKEFESQILQLPVTVKNTPVVSHGDEGLSKTNGSEHESKIRSSHVNKISLDEKDPKTHVIENNGFKQEGATSAVKPRHIDVNEARDSYKKGSGKSNSFAKRSPTNHTSDLPSYIPINQPINSSIFEVNKIEDIKFIDSELDCTCSSDDDLNSNLSLRKQDKSQSDGTRSDQCNRHEMNNYDHVVTKSENMNHKNSTQGTIKRIGVDNSVPSTSRRAYQPEQSYIAEPARERLSSIRSTLPISANSRGSSVEQENKNAAGLNGLRNIGNTCFMNSVLQCLSNTRLLAEYLKKDSCSGELGSGGALIKAFSTLIGELWAPGNSRVVNTSLLKSQVQKIAPRFMGYAQQDAQEFLRYLLEGLHEDINRVKTKPRGITTEIDDNLSDSQKAAEAWARYIRSEDSHIVDLFVGQLKSTLRCTICGHSSVTFDPFWDLSLPIPSRVGQLRLNQCLDLFTKEEILDGDEKPTCSKCQVRRKCTKSFSIQKFPKILVIHLKRFSPTERFRGKLNSLIDFPLTELDLSSYAANSGTPCIYDLYAVSNHSGTTYSGHYTAYCKHPYTHEWHEYNDSRVSTISSRSIVSNEAYVLFYELSNHQSSHL